MIENISVLHISTADNLGGSGRSAYRIHAGLREAGVKSRMLVGIKSMEDEDIDLIYNKERWRILDQVIGKCTDLFGLQYLFYPSSFKLQHHTWFKEADIVQFYNTHGGYFSHLALPGISKRKPIVWRLSDMWPMTGHCAYSYDCERFKFGCGSCPYLSEYPSLRRDMTAFLWKIKNNIYKCSNINIVAPSKWIFDLAKQSPLINRFKISIIPNGLNTQIFKPIKKEIARELLNIDINKKVIFFSAHSIKDHRKGSIFLKEGISRLSKKNMQNIILLVNGSQCGNCLNNYGFPVKYVNFTNNDTMMAVMYSAADLFILPTLADNLPNGIIESMACGTPVISFNTGGVPEAISHMKTGYIAQYKNVNDLSVGIKMLLENNNLRNQMSINCREIVKERYTKELQAKRYQELYKELLKK